MKKTLPYVGPIRDNKIECPSKTAHGTGLKAAKLLKEISNIQKQELRLYIKDVISNFSPKLQSSLSPKKTIMKKNADPTNWHEELSLSDDKLEYTKTIAKNINSKYENTEDNYIIMGNYFNVSKTVTSKTLTIEIEGPDLLKVLNQIYKEATSNKENTVSSNGIFKMLK